MTALRAYTWLTFLMWPLFHALLLRRRWQGKELAFRVRERRGVATKKRGGERLIWFHGASVGETLSILPLANHFLEVFPDAELLITSGTQASARLIETRLPARAIHQFIPLDHPAWVERFLATWQPDVAIWAESEIWPNLLRRCRARAIPVHLVNARLSAKSFGRWQRRTRMAHRLFSTFASIIAQSGEDVAHFIALGGENAVNGGNIKFAGQVLPSSQTDVAAWGAVFANRPTWLAASTHPGEEALILQAHDALKHRHPNLLTLIAPRHVERVAELQSGLLAGRTHMLHSEGPDRVSSNSLLLVDAMGVLGPLYQTCGVTLVAGSLVPGIGGHNPIEPARNGSSVLIGGHADAQRDVVEAFKLSDALIQISDTTSLIDAVDGLLTDEERRRELQQRGRELVERQADVLRLYSNALLPHVEEALTPKTAL